MKNARQKNNSSNQGKNKPGSKKNNNNRRRPDASSNPQRQSSAAIAYSTGQSSMLPDIRSTRSTSRIRHRELIGSLSGSPNFTNAFSFQLNPGITTTFPWLSSQAIGWEQYHFHSLKFCYYTRTGTITTGSVIMSPDYDAGDAPPLSEQVASAYQDTREDAPWKDIVCKLDENSMHPDGSRKFVRIQALSSNLDIKTYDVGVMYINTIDGDTVPWGKIWAEYDISFFTPQLPPTGSFDLQYQSITSTVPSSANLIGGTASVVVGSSNLFKIVGEQMSFVAAGNFMVVYHALAGTSVTQTALPVASLGAQFTPYLGSVNPTQAGSGGTFMTQVFIVDTPEGGLITFNNTIVGGGQFAEISAISVSPSFG